MSWTDQPHLGFDLESTGTDQNNGRIATAYAAVIHNDRVVHQRDWIIAIDVEMPEEASRVNKLTTEHLRANGRPAADVIPEIVNALRYAVRSRMPIVAYNGCFDITFTDRETRRWMGSSLEEAIGAPVFPVLDPFVIWKALERRKGKRRLTEACEALGVELGDKAHEAAADAVAAVRVLAALAKKYPRIAGMDLSQLHEAQVRWRAEQRNSLRDYFNSIGQAHDGVPADWPLIPFAPQAVLPI